MNKPSIVYFLYFITFCLLIVFCCQLFIQASSTKNLKKTTGRIISIDVKETVFTNGRRGVKGRPFYAILITLNNKKTYTIALNDDNWGLAYKLSPGDFVSVYYLPKIIGWFSLDFLVYNDRVSQVEENNSAVLKFEQQKKDDLPTLGIVAFAIFTAFYQLFKLKTKRQRIN